MRKTNTTSLRAQYARYQNPNSPPKRRPIKLWLIAVGILVVFMGSKMSHPNKSVAAVEPAKPTRSAAQVQSAVTAMDNTINTVLDENPTVDITATIIDPTNGKSYNYGPDVAYEAASVAKLITAAELLHETEKGSIRLSTKLVDGQTAGSALKKMVVKSDNASWESLNDKMTRPRLLNYAASIGITDYTLSNNSLTSKDIALLLYKLQSGKLLNKENTNLLLGYMAKANEADMIPPIVPNGVKMYHKAGLLDDRAHDAAILDDGNESVVIVVFTNGHGTYNFPTRIEAIQTIAKSAMTAFEVR